MSVARAKLIHHGIEHTQTDISDRIRRLLQTVRTDQITSEPPHRNDYGVDETILAAGLNEQPVEKPRYHDESQQFTEHFPDIHTAQQQGAKGPDRTDRDQTPK
jgi:hypothetical protein